MNTKRIDGIQLDKLLRNGLALLQQQEEEINALNVFPVADGDTGTNMFHTLENGLRVANPVADAGRYLMSLSEGMLLGARGNSGVILSQFFKGMAVELAREDEIGPGELRNGLIDGYKTAYQAVLQPVEGTMLTVAREGIENIKSQIHRSSSIEEILSLYVAEMRKSMSFTPEMLSVLKEAGVVDSGAAGFIAIFDGMLRSLYGQDIPLVSNLSPAPTRRTVDEGIFNADSVFEDGYCLEFVLQRMNGEQYNPRFTVEKFTRELQLFGSSIVVAEDKGRVKVHIHTMNPGRTVSLAEEYGVFLDFKLENMQIQHNERDAKLAEVKKRPFAKLAVADGEGMKQLMADLGCDAVLDGGKTVNLSTEEFLDEFLALQSEQIVVLPNNVNAVMAAKQAAALCRDCTVTVLETKDMVEGYFALAMDVGDEEKADYRIEQMRRGLDGLSVLGQTEAVKTYHDETVTCAVGDQIALLNGEIVTVSDRAADSLLMAIAMVDGMDEKETCLIFTGKNATEELNDELISRLQVLYPMLDVQLIEGGQEIYRYLVGIA